jgi:hypothetical protein
MQANVSIHNNIYSIKIHMYSVWCTFILGRRTVYTVHTLMYIPLQWLVLIAGGGGGGG